MAKPYQEGKGWSVRVRAKGQDIYLSGYPSELAARKASENERASIENAGKPARLGPRKTTLAQAIQQYALERLPALKGARRDAGRLNRYLRLSGLRTIKLEPIDRKEGRGRGVYWAVTLKDEKSGRPVPESLKAHRSNQLDNSIKSDALRKHLGATMMADITPYQIQQIVDAMVEEGYEPATIAHERSELRRLFNHAKKSWLWTQPASNPASFLKLPPISNSRDRIISNEEWLRLTAALKAYGNIYALPALSLLLETTMRSSEPLLHATWADVDLQRCLIHLQDAKAGPRAVPLSPAAISILEELKLLAGEVSLDTPILPTTYEALKKAWVVACEEAGVDNANPHDLRHTGTTRYAIEFNGNMPVLKLITGHKTDSQLMRYINLKVDHVVSLMHDKPMDEANAPAGLRIGNIRAPKEVRALPLKEPLPQQLPDNVIAFTRRGIA